MIAARNKQDEPQKPIQPWYCPDCLARGYRQMLMRIYPAPGTHIEIKCPRCKHIQTKLV
jgi:rubrerythrin